MAICLASSLFAQPGFQRLHRQRFFLGRAAFVLQRFDALDALPAFGASGPCAALQPGQLAFEQALPLSFTGPRVLFPFAFQLQKAFVICLVPVQLPMIDLRNTVADPVQKIPVVRNHHQRALIAFQLSFQPFHHFIIQVVGRLIQNQYFAGAYQRGRHGQTFALPAGKVPYRFAKVRHAQLCQNRLGPVAFLLHIAPRAAQHML